MVSKATKVNRLALGRNWFDTSDAAKQLGVAAKVLTARIRPMIVHQSRSLQGHGARCVGYAYARGDIERIGIIRKVIGCNALEATKILWSIRQLEQRGQLERVARIELQHDLED